MAGAVKTLTFAVRQPGIPECGGVVYLKTSEGDLRAEYLSGSELKKEDATWSYSFLIQEDDLPGTLTLDEVTNSIIVSPFWECYTERDCDDEEDECEAVRRIGCFDNVEIIETLGENDYVAILQHDETCDVFCLAAMNPYEFVAQSSTPP